MLALLLFAASTHPGCIVWLSTEPHTDYGVHVRAETTIEAPIDVVLRTLEDFEHYPEYMPRVRRTEIRPGGFVLTEIDSPWPLKDVWFIAEVKRTRAGSGYVMSWTMREGNLRENTGAWWLTPLPGNRTRLRYDGRVMVKKVIPQSLLRLVQEYELPRVVQALRVRAVGQAPLECRQTSVKAL